MTNQWRKANAEQQRRGFVAICMVQESIHLGNGARVPYLRQYFYKAEMLERRAKRGDSAPEWYAVDTSEAWLDYIDTGRVSSEIEAVLPTLGSYGKNAA